MILVHVSDLTAFRNHPATQPSEDGTPSPLIRLIDKKRTNIAYGDNESLAFLADLSGLEIIEQVPEIVQVLGTEVAAVGGEVQATDPDTGEKLWTTEAGTEIERTRVQTGTLTVIPTRQEKRLVDGWSVTQVEQDVLDELTGEVVDTKTVDQWNYTGETTTDADGNTIYPAKYEYVEVTMPEEAYESPVYGWEEKEAPVVTRKPLMVAVEPDPEVKAIYDRIYPRTRYDVTNEEGMLTTVTPPLLFGFLDGHI
jgi:hypothetical protein